MGKVKYGNFDVTGDTVLVLKVVIHNRLEGQGKGQMPQQDKAYYKTLYSALQLQTFHYSINLNKVLKINSKISVHYISEIKSCSSF